MTGSACSCGAGLAPGQRYCLACGAPTPQAGELRSSLWSQPVLHAQAPTAPPSQDGFAFGDARQSLRVATVAFALVLGVSSWAGARLTVPPPATAQTYVSAPAALALTSTPEPLATSDGDDPGLAGDDTGSSDSAGDTTLAELPEAPMSMPGGDDAATPTGAGPTSDRGGDDAGDDATDSPAATPELERIVVFAVPPLAAEDFTERAGAAPYLAGTLTRRGTLLSGFHGAAPSALASNVALLSGQAPNDATLAACPSFAPVTPGTIGDDEQAAGIGCLYPADVFTTGDLLGALDHSWAIYSGAGAEACAASSPGDPLPAGRPAPLAFASVAGGKDCATQLRPLTELVSDLKAGDAPALAYAELAGGSPAEIDAELRLVVPELLEDGVLPHASAIVIVPAHAPQDGSDGSRAPADPQRKWTPPGAGGGRTAALVVSPLATPGAVIDTPLDHYDVGRTLALALGVRPLGFTARDDVAGIPAGVWARWKPAP